MIRAFNSADLEPVLTIWLEASIAGHDFVAAAYWEGKVKDMRSVYLPASTTFVFENSDGNLVGFLSLVDNYIAALFVNPQTQGRGVGTQLMDYVKSRYASLALSVYSKNEKSIDFYHKQGFVIVGEQEEPHTKEMETLMSYNNG